MRIATILKNRVTSPLKVMFQDIKNGQFKIGITRFLVSVFRGTKISYFLSQKIHNMIMKILEKDFLYILDKYRDYSAKCEYDAKSPVWVCWMQGYDNAPIIVKKCIDSIKCSTNHPVHIITKDNIDTFIQLPDYITKKYNNKSIMDAHFADVLRMALLSKYGGFWIDATIFIPEKLPEEIFQYQFYTCKRIPKQSGCISDYMWTTFFNGCQKNCIVQTVVRDLLFEYWKKKDYSIDYLLLDYFIMLVYRNIPEAKKLIDNVPYNNPCMEELQNRMSMAFNKNDYDQLLYNSDTYLFKLSWRMNFKKETDDGNTTYFAQFLEL